MYKLVYLLSILAISVSPVFAGSGHEHNPDGSHKVPTKIDKKAAQDISQKVITHFINEGNLDKSWAKADLKNVGQKVFKKEKEWVISYNNPQEKDTKKTNFYVFLSLDGEYLGSNFTGQ